jgi:ATP-dependent RNA helicase DeaD
VLDLISRHSLMLHSCRYIVLDEADEMLDLGFLEDVEKILSLTPERPPDGAVQRDHAAEIRALAERHLYDPVTVKVKAATLTIDTVEQFFLETKPADKTAALVRVLEAEAPDAGDRLHAHEDPLRAALPHAARQGHERQGAARRHEPGLRATA